MPREFPRARRIEEQLKRLLSELVRREVKDPRVGLITITAVSVTRDLTRAKVYFTPFAGIGDPELALEALRHAAGYLRIQVRNQMRLRAAPELVFQLDDSLERGARLSSLIHDAVEGDRSRHVDPEPEKE
jgi:ribosome-binding factor A